MQGEPWVPPHKQEPSCCPAAKRSPFPFAPPSRHSQGAYAPCLSFCGNRFPLCFNNWPRCWALNRGSSVSRLPSSLWRARYTSTFGNVVLTGVPGAYFVTFTGSLAAGNQSQLGIAANLTGGSGATASFGLVNGSSAMSLPARHTTANRTSVFRSTLSSRAHA